jgi:putative acetyltransferase
MIRAYQDNDLADVVNIWYAASKIAHSFISPEILTQQKEAIINIYIPKANIWLIQEQEQTVGFIALLENLIGGLFISPNHQHKGYGTRLIEYAKSLESNLLVEVFQANHQAQNFYKKCGFVIIGETLEATTSLPLFTMSLNPT